MKTFKHILFFSMLLFFATSCEEGIDPISKVEPGEDEEAPGITIDNPKDDIIIPFTDEETDVTFEYEVTDDIEIDSYEVLLDGETLAEYDEFKDYRKSVESYSKENMSIGEYTLEINATDKSGKTTTETITFEISNEYVKKYEDEIFYMPFEGNLYMDLISESEADTVGNPDFTDGIKGDAYAGAEGSYLTYPTEGLLGGEEFSAAFWYKPNADADRAGILVAGPQDEENPEAMNDRKKGFRFFREGDDTNQTLKLNVGTGEGEAWFDGGNAATIDVTADEWVHVAFTISATEGVVYIDGEQVAQGEFDGVDWTGCDIMSIMSGAPRFTGWGHLADQHFMDELRLFDVALTQEQIQAIMDNES